MLRHRLAALFEPRAVVVVADRQLPVELDTPGRLRKAVTCVSEEAALKGEWPQQLAGVEPGERLDLALVCVPPASLTPVLRSEEHTSELQSRENLVCRL